MISTDKVQDDTKKPKSENEAVIIKPIQEKISGVVDEAPNLDIQKGDALGSQDKIKEATLKFLNPKTFGVFIDSLSGMAAKSWGEHWKLETYERDSLSEALCGYLNVVLPEILKEQPELFTLCVTAGVILIPRVMKTDWKRKGTKDQGAAGTAVNLNPADRTPDLASNAIAV